MAKFPVDAPLDRVLRALAKLGFRVVGSGNHVSLLRENADGTRTTATIPNHRQIKSTLRYGPFSHRPASPVTSFCTRTRKVDVAARLGAAGFADAFAQEVLTERTPHAPS